MDALFGAEAETAASAAAAAGAGPGAGGPGGGGAGGAPHPALVHAVEVLAAQAWPQAAAELRAGAASALPAGAAAVAGAGEEEPPRKRPSGPQQGAERLEAALAALRSRQWAACGQEAQAARAATWASFVSGRGWQRACDRELFMLAELLAGLCASAEGDAAAALRCADHVFTFAAAGGFRDAALLLVRLLDDAAREQRVPIGSAPPANSATFPSALPPWAQRVLPSGAAEALRVGAAAAAEEVARRLAAGRPLVLEGLLEAWPARQRWASLGYWDSLVGHRLVPVEVGAAVGTAGWREELMPMGRFLREHLAASCEHFGGAQPSEQEPASRESSPGTAYLAQHELLEQCPALRGDVAVPEPWRRAFGQAARSNVWLGTHGTCTPCHWDSYDNCLAQVQGWKRALLLPPEAGRFLHVDDGSGGGTAAQGNLSPVDLERPDLAAFPDFAGAPAVLCADLRPGDALFIPRGWWHQVRALSPSASVNFWF